jgi:hypothetical protein
MSVERFDTVVVGGVQAGLAMGYYLARQRRRFLIVDSGAAIGQTWRERWDSMRLFTPAHFTHLPGLAFPAPRGYLPSKDEMAGYLRSYARRFDLQVRLRWQVEHLTRDGDGYHLRHGDQIVRADRVVLATGPVMRPHLPSFAARLDPSVVSLHAVGYRNPGQLPEGPVLVVGAGTPERRSRSAATGCSWPGAIRAVSHHRRRPGLPAHERGAHGEHAGGSPVPRQRFAKGRDAAGPGDSGSAGRCRGEVFSPA